MRIDSNNWAIMSKNNNFPNNYNWFVSVYIQNLTRKQKSHFVMKICKETLLSINIFFFYKLLQLQESRIISCPIKCLKYFEVTKLGLAVYIYEALEIEKNIWSWRAIRRTLGRTLHYNIILLDFIVVIIS